MKISILVEGKTETAFLPALRLFLAHHLPGKMPRLDVIPYDGRIPTGEKLARVVKNALSDKIPADHVIALTDVYTGSHPPDFQNAADAKLKMTQWVGPEHRFHPHVAQHDFEAWLLPYWSSIQRLAGHNKAAPSGNPENVNHNHPPAHRLVEIFRIGQCRKAYIKPRDAARILRDNDLLVAINACSELKLFVNRLITLSGGVAIP